MVETIHSMHVIFTLGFCQLCNIMNHHVTNEYTLTVFPINIHFQNTLLCIGLSSCSVMSCGNEIHLFWPHSRNTQGQTDPLDTSVLLHYVVKMCKVLKMKSVL